MYGAKAKNLVSLLKQNNIVGAEGQIKIVLLDTEVNVADKSAVGNLLQEWLESWLTLNGFYHRVNDNTQIPPDFYLDESNDTNLLEVKTFDYIKSPNFDIANFDAFVRSLRTSAFRLDADYLIFGYSLSNGVIKINDIWLKKVWEITCPSNQYAIRTQVKQNKIINIRPYNFKSNSNGFQPLGSRLKFVEAIKKTLEVYQDPDYADAWFQEVSLSYKHFANTEL